MYLLQQTLDTNVVSKITVCISLSMTEIGARCACAINGELKF